MTRARHAIYSEGADWVPSVLADPQRIWLPKELIALSTAHTPYFTPGTDWHYANTNYVLLGLVIEAATGRSVGDELRDRIFQPLGLPAPERRCRFGGTWCDEAAC